MKQLCFEAINRKPYFTRSALNIKENGSNVETNSQICLKQITFKTNKTLLPSNQLSYKPGEANVGPPMNIQTD